MPNAVVEERCDAPSRVDGALQLSTAVFRQMNKEKPRTHHDALEFPDGQTVLLLERQEATVLQFPAQPVAAEAEAVTEAKATRKAVIRSWIMAAGTTVDTQAPSACRPAFRRHG